MHVMYLVSLIYESFPLATKQSIKVAMDEAISAIESKLSARMDIRTKKVQVDYTLVCSRVLTILSHVTSTVHVSC